MPSAGTPRRTSATGSASRRAPSTRRADEETLASAISHAVCAVALGTAFHARARPLRFWLLGAACAAAPDLDVAAFAFGVPYAAPLGHRGASHSLVFAAVLAAYFALRGFPRAPDLGITRARAFCFLFLATASHALLDAMTNGGLGVAVFWPFDTRRYFLPFRPIQVSPIGVGAFFSETGLAVLRSELVWLWLPAAAFAAACLAWRRLAARSPR